MACFALLLCALLIVAARAGAANPDSLREKLETGRAEAGAIAAELQQAQSEQASAEAEASEAAAREQELSGLLARGERRAARLGREVERSQRRLQAEKERLRRARKLLAERLVAIYESGSPSAASVVLSAGDYSELATQSEYLREIEESDSALAARVAEVRNDVGNALAAVAEREREAVAYNEQLTAARGEISSARASAEASAVELQQVKARREAALAALRTDIDRWVDEVRAAREAAEEEASQAAAEEEVGRWLGGPYSIPTYIVMCESGGNYSALNPSSGAGGAYQILPSTWEAYGGQGAPHLAPKAEQDRIAAEIWADSGGSAWVCA
ncbi:MAG TPA: transglycosylase family protein [Solirubrobacterales bacterium]|nr:transglycosylase family protein [Solirubrobacterales bacterium]